MTPKRGFPVAAASAPAELHALSKQACILKARRRVESGLVRDEKRRSDEPWSLSKAEQQKRQMNDVRRLRATSLEEMEVWEGREDSRDPIDFVETDGGFFKSLFDHSRLSKLRREG